MNNGFYYQLLSVLTKESNRFNYPRILRDLVRTSDLDEVTAVEDALAAEINDASIDSAQDVEYFLHVSEMAMLFALHRDSFAVFNDLSENVEKRLHKLRGVGNNMPDIDAWLWYLGYLRVASNRLTRRITIEQWELEIDNIEWEDLSEPLIKKISGITGYVYLNEEVKEKFNKSRFWLQQAINGNDMAYAMVYYMNLADYYLTDPTPDSQKRIEDHIRKLEDTARTTHDPNLSRIYRSAILDLQARALVSRKTVADDDNLRVEENLRAVREVEKNIDYEGKTYPSFARAFLKLTFANYYLSLTTGPDLDKEEIEDLVAMANDNVNEALSIARRVKDEALREYLSLERLRVASERSTKISEREFKEVLGNYRKTSNLPAIVKASSYFAQFFIVQARELKDQNQIEKGSEMAKRAFDILADMLKRGYKRKEEGGFYLVVHAMRQINVLLYDETHRPGVSWAVANLDEYFESVQEIIDELEDNLNEFGFSLFQAFRTYYTEFEPVSHFNIKVFLRYQYYALKLIRLSAILSQDEGARKLAAMLEDGIDDENSPIHFLRADWKEFKKVPNSVRNKVLNKCISISKGDLPLAAEHLDFSYRNLRSYITFKEVNRLGNFLDMRETHHRQLEQGIRLLFHDLYKRGTIFEVVFDMPKFLVEHSKSGFSSQDLEEALDIKGTTAKKYIKIMMDIGLIKLERSVGRKHFYKLRKDNVMNRLGQDTKVLAAAE